MPIPTRRTDQRDVVDILIEDHREVEELFILLETGLGGAAQRRNAADIMIAELVRHAVAEEAYVYPAARAVLPGGGPLVEHEIAAHRETEQLMRRLEAVSPTDAAFDDLVRAVVVAARRHAADEERDLFPALREACDPVRLGRLGEQVERAKHLAPTRPDPTAPHRTPLSTLVAPGGGLVDRLRDALTGRPNRPEEME